MKTIQCRTFAFFALVLYGVGACGGADGGESPAPRPLAGRAKAEAADPQADDPANDGLASSNPHNDCYYKGYATGYHHCGPKATATLKAHGNCAAAGGLLGSSLVEQDGTCGSWVTLKQWRVCYTCEIFNPPNPGPPDPAEECRKKNGSYLRCYYYQPGKGMVCDWKCIKQGYGCQTC